MADETPDGGSPLEPQRGASLSATLDDWRANVGGPVAVDAGPAAAPQLAGIDVLCWNIAIGLGRLEPVLERLRASTGPPVAAAPDRPLVLLLQEAYRADASIPEDAGSGHHGGRLIARERLDIVTLAESLGLSLRYSPSMRNGMHPSDRGNAVLASVRLGAAHAFLLPFVRQRRVVVTAQLAGHPDFTFVSAHLDTHGRAPERGRTAVGAGRAAQARALAAALDDVAGDVVIGADLNSLFGMADPAVRALVQAGLHPARRVGSWGHTFHRPLRLLLDHVMFRSPDHRIAHMTVTRIDEVAGDRSRTVFGSDHHPLLARTDFHAS
jgi:hypothetical protein